MARTAEDRAEAIMTAARRQFTAHGPDATIDAIAAQAGVGKGTVFLYWPTKARLLQAVVRLETARMLAGLADDLRAGTIPLTLAAILNREITAAVADPTMAARLVSLDDTTDDEFPRDVVHRIVTAMHRHGLAGDAGIDIDEVVTALETLATGALTTAVTDPTRLPTLLAATHRLLTAAYDRTPPTPQAAADALDEAVHAIESGIDRLTTAAAPAHPTAAVFHPRGRTTPPAV